MAISPIVKIYPGGNPADPSGWPAPVDISSYVRYSQPITYTYGRSDEGNQVDASTLSLTVDNRDGRFSSRNPNSPYYGSLGLNTPITLSTSCASDSFTRTASPGLGGSWTSGSSYSSVGTNGQSALTAAGLASSATYDFGNAFHADVRLTVWPTVVATGASLIYGIILRSTDTSNRLLLTCEFATGGLVDAKIRTVEGGVFTILSSTTGIASYSASDKFRMRAQSDGGSLRLKVWKPANPLLPDADEPTGWTVTATNGSLIGNQLGIYMWRVAGNTNAGTVTFAFDDFAAEALEFSGTISQLPPRWDVTGNNSWTPIQASGILRRLQQGSGVLQSPLERQLSNRTDMKGYWPLSDGTDSRTFGSTKTGVSPATFTLFNPASEATLPGGSVAPTATDSLGRIKGYTPFRQTGSGFSAMVFCKLQSLPASAETIFTFVGNGAGIVQWQFLVEPGPNITTRGIDNDGAVVFTTTNALGSTADLTNWVAFQLETTWTAGTLSWAMIYHDVTREDFYAQSGSFGSGNKATCQQFILNGTSVNASFAHVWLGENTLPFADSTFQQVAAGWAGELAADRITRLCGENNIPVLVESGSTFAMGPQKAGTLIDNLRAAADADFGILYEAGSGLGFRTRENRYNRAVTMSLSKAAGQIADPPEPIDDDQGVRNDWTVNRQDGSFARVFDQSHIDARGHYPDSTTINVETDGVLADHAGWRLFLGTRPDLRWPRITLDFARNPSLLTSWRSKRFAWRVQVALGLSQIPGADPDVIVEGYSATITPHLWRVDLNCSAAKPWDSPLLDEVRLDTDGSHLDVGVTTTSTSWTVVTDSGPIWAPTSILPGEVPFVIECEGEWVTVTNVGDLSGGKQVLTVTRSTNSVVKSHAAGAGIQLAVPTYLSL